MDIKIKNILFPTDFSDNAKHALPFALKLAKKTRAKLHIIHSIEEPYDFAPMVENIKKNVTHKVNKLYEEMLENILKNDEYKDLSIKTHLFEGRTVYSVISTIQQYKIDLVVMGTQGRSALEQLFFGSTTSEVVQQATIPVLTIPEDAEYSGFRHLLFTTDYGPEDIDALKYTVKFATLFNSSIQIIHVSKKIDTKTDLLFRGFKDLVRENINYKKLKFELLEDENLLAAVTKKIHDQSTSLIVMVRYQNLFSVIGKKHSKEMSQSTSVPLLVIPGKMDSSKLNVVI